MSDQNLKALNDALATYRQALAKGYSEQLSGLENLSRVGNSKLIFEDGGPGEEIVNKTRNQIYRIMVPGGKKQASPKAPVGQLTEEQKQKEMEEILKRNRK